MMFKKLKSCVELEVSDRAAEIVLVSIRNSLGNWNINREEQRGEYIPREYIYIHTYIF